MSEMEPEVKSFLSKISSSLSVGLLWLLINTTIGIGFNFAFFEDKPSIGNYIFYAWFLISLCLLIVFYRKKWKF
jgi:Mg2+ and Co2+ transporter CorA